MSDEQLEGTLFRAIRLLGPEGKLSVPASKGAYRELFPRHVYVANGRVYLADGRCLWWGDLDLSTQDCDRLRQLAAVLGEALCVLHEAHAPDREPQPDLSRRVAAFEADGRIEFDEDVIELASNGRLVYREWSRWPR